MQLHSLISQRFQAALEGWVENPQIHAQRIAVAKDAKHGDYQANIAMPLQKQLGAKPMDIAAKIVEKLDIEDICAAPEIAKPGFINLRMRDDFLAQCVTEIATDERLTVGEQNSQTFVIDYSSPNVAKPMHVGHIRSTVIGDALARILRFLGHRVIADNHLGDWGTQFGMIIYGYKHFVDANAFEQQPVVELSRIYRIVQQVIGYQSAVGKLDPASQKLEESRTQLACAESALASNPNDKKLKKDLKATKRAVDKAAEQVAELQDKVEAVSSSPVLLGIAEEHPELETRAQLETVKLHEGDQENLKLWETFMPISISEIESVYQRLDINFDHTFGESFYHPMLEGVVDGLLKKGLAQESDGAICVFLDGYDAPMIIRKSDGAYLYATTDLATIDYRMEHFAPDSILYVVDHRQGEHFQKLFDAAAAIGYDEVDLQHVSFGTVLGPDGKPFKTRSGSVVGLDYLLDEAIERAHQVACNPERLARAGLDLSDDEKREIANVIGLGAIKYADLSHNRTSDYKFDIDAMVQLEGETAAYIQYMYARCCSIIRKSEIQVDASTVAETKILLEEPAERTLALHLLQFEDALLQTVEEYYPSILTGYLYNLAKQFATFFDQCHVNNASSEELKLSRLAICHTVRRVLQKGLELLGIGVVERM